jgi:hypothetical protein
MHYPKDPATRALFSRLAEQGRRTVLRTVKVLRRQTRAVRSESCLLSKGTTEASFLRLSPLHKPTHIKTLGHARGEASLPLTIVVIHPHPPPDPHRGVGIPYLAAENLGGRAFSTGKKCATPRARMCRSADAAALVV